MSDTRDTLPTQGRRLPSIFDYLPLGVPVSLDDLELLMQVDTERRVLAVLDRVFGSQPEPLPPEPAEPT